MFSYRDQIEIIERIKIREGEHKTLDCPFCGGSKKFTIDRLNDGRLVWNCFRASCNVRGSKSYGRSITAAKAYVAGADQSRPTSKVLPLPELTTKVENRENAISYLRSVNSLDAYEAGLIDIRYDPKTKRVLFYNSDKTGAVGRALGSGPKWLSYGDTSTGIHVGGSNIAVVVEDVASACSVSRNIKYTGVALLGTNITSTIKNALLMYKELYIVLDNDASRKSVALSKKLRGSVFIRVTEKDLKELSIKEIADLLTATPKQRKPSLEKK